MEVETYSSSDEPSSDSGAGVAGLGEAIDPWAWCDGTVDGDDSGSNDSDPSASPVGGGRRRCARRLPASDKSGDDDPDDSQSSVGTLMPANHIAFACRMYSSWPMTRPEKRHRHTGLPLSRAAFSCPAARNAAARSSAVAESQPVAGSPNPCFSLRHVGIRCHAATRADAATDSSFCLGDRCDGDGTRSRRSAGLRGDRDRDLGDRRAQTSDRHLGGPHPRPRATGLQLFPQNSSASLPGGTQC